MVQINQTGFLSKINGDLRSAALTYAAEGLAIIPLHFLTQSGKCSCGKSDCPSPAKHPLTQHGLTDASKDLKQIEAWWQRYPKANIGVCTGAVSGGLIVIDVDVKKGGAVNGLKLPQTVQVETGNGFHLWFQTDQGIRNSAGKLGQGIDVRGDGGYVVAPPSVHYSGKTYNFASIVDIAKFPANLFSILDPQPAVKEQKPDDVIVSDETALDEKAPSGQRNSFLTSFAGRLRSFGLSEYEIESSLIAINRQRCQPPLAESEVRRIAKSVGRYSPTAAVRLESRIEDPPEPEPATAAQPILNKHTQNNAQAVPDTSFGLGGAITLENLLLTVWGEQEPILNALYRGDWGIVAALPNLGKSTFMLNLSIALAAGRPFLPFTPERVKPRRVLYLDYEASDFRLQSQLFKMLDVFLPVEKRLCEQNLHFVLHPMVNNLPLLLTERGSIKALHEYIKHHQIDLVIVDTLAQATWLNDENNNSEVQRKVVMPVSQLAHHTNTAVLLIHHEGKGSEMEGENFLQFRTRGASALVAGARYQITMMPADKKSRKLVEFHCSKDKGEKFDPVTMAIDQVTRWFQITEAPVTPPKQSLDEVIIETLESHTSELSLGDLESLILGTPRRTIQNKLTELVRQKRVIRTKKDHYRSAWLGEESPDPVGAPPKLAT